MMKKNKLGATELMASVIGFGGIIVMNATPQDAARYVATAVDHGVNYFDVAPSYGNAQSMLGPSLMPYRKNVYLACKTLKRDFACAKEQMEESFKLLKTDYFDVYQFHGVNYDDEVDTLLGPNGALEMAVKAKQEGKIGHIGFTSHNPKTALRLMDAFDFETVMFPINWAYWLGRNAGQEVLAKATQKNMGKLAIKTMAKRPLAKGEVTDYKNCWYYPICDDPELAHQAMAFTYAQGVDVEMSPGEYRMLELMLNIMEADPELTLTDAMKASLVQRVAREREILFDGDF